MLFNLARALGKATINASRGILLTGSPRSGTTWLGEALSSNPNTLMITEPFAEGKALNSAGFSWRTYRSADAEWERGRQYIEKLLGGHGIIPASLMDNDDKRCISAERLVLKCVRVNRLLPWLAENFTELRLIYIIRHPCAVVSSQMLHPAFVPAKWIQEESLELTNKIRPDLTALAESLETEEEVRAFEWCLDQYIPLSSENKNRWLMVNYENLMLEGIPALEKVFKYAGIDPSFAEQAFSRNSRERRDWSVNFKTASPEKKINSWIDRIDPERIRKIIDIVERFGITGFSDDPKPKPERISVRQ